MIRDIDAWFNMIQLGFTVASFYKRGEYWQFRMWLPKDNTYARKSLRKRSEITTIENGKAAHSELYPYLPS